MKITAIVASAGIGKRMGTLKDKPYLNLCGKPVLIHTLNNLSKNRLVNNIIVVVHKDSINNAKKLISSEHIPKIKDIIPGGVERINSVYNGIKNIDTDSDVVIIHDGVRPFIKNEYIQKALEYINKYDGVVIAVRVKNTIKETNTEDIVINTLERSNIWEIQTPQVFKKEIIVKAYEQALQENILATDDSFLVERMGGKIKLVNGGYDNIKITTKEDMLIAEGFLSNYMV